MKPYVEYGVGIQKHWADKFNAYGQVMLRGGGRNGVALSAGFRWAIGKDPTKVHKEQNVKNVQNVQKIKDNQKVQNVQDVKNFNSSAKTIATNEIPTTSTSLSGRKAVIKQLPRK
jgi:hypothetical protein